MKRDHRTMIVPAALVETVRELSDTWPEGVGMFITPLCPIDSEDATPTHYISTGLIDFEVAEALPWKEHDRFDEEGRPLEAVQRVGNPTALTAMVKRGKPTAKQTDLEALIAACDISTQPPRDALERIGLRAMV